jgi:hypothetical protein
MPPEHAMVTANCQACQGQGFRRRAFGIIDVLNFRGDIIDQLALCSTCFWQYVRLEERAKLIYRIFEDDGKEIPH